MSPLGDGWTTVYNLALFGTAKWAFVAMTGHDKINLLAYVVSGVMVQLLMLWQGFPKASTGGHELNGCVVAHILLQWSLSTFFHWIHGPVVKEDEQKENARAVKT